MGIIKRKQAIVTQTITGSDIDNDQSFEMYFFGEQIMLKELKRDHPLAEVRIDPTKLYNCHGMTFASRRTGIYQVSEVKKILKEDRYQEIDLKSVLPGDVIIYFDEKNDVEHSGVVLQVEKADIGLISLKVVSKWGQGHEMIHWADDCPYNIKNKKYYRNAYSNSQ